MNHPFVQIVLYSLKYIVKFVWSCINCSFNRVSCKYHLVIILSRFILYPWKTMVLPSDWVIIGDDRTKRVFWDPITSGHWSRLSQLTAKTINQWDSEADTDFSLGCNLLLWDPIDWLRPAQFLKHGHKSLAFWPTDQQFLESGSVSKMICYKSEISTSFSTGQYLPKLPCTDQLNKLLDNLP